MSDKVKTKAQELRDAQVKLDADRAKLRAEIEKEVAPLRAKREKISLQIVELQKELKELSDRIAATEALAQPPRAPGSLGFSVTAPDGSKQKIG